ncbi:hypothetical protein H101_03295 [Trichophyton interdigitale H6]|nr:hypothetical protein H101_03295 [Trichophyton interdigitale H6]
MVSAHCDRLAGGTSRRFMALCPPREKWEDHRALRMKVDVPRSASLFEQGRPNDYHSFIIDLLTAASCSDATALGSLVRHALGPAVQGSWEGVCPIRQVEAGMPEGARYFRRSHTLAERGSTSGAEARGAARSGSEGPSGILAGKLVLQRVPHLSGQ